MRNTRWRALGALTAVAALTLSACGGGSDDADNAQQDPGAVTDTTGAATTDDTSGATNTGTDTGTAAVARLSAA